MAPLEPKPPDPASSLPSLPLRCSFLPGNCPSLSHFSDSSSHPVSSLRAIDPHLGYSRFGCDSVSSWLHSSTDWLSLFGSLQFRYQVLRSEFQVLRQCKSYTKSNSYSDLHFHAFLLPFLPFAGRSPDAHAAALGWYRQSDPFLVHPHNPCTTGPHLAGVATIRRSYALLLWALPCLDSCSTVFCLLFPLGSGFVPVLSHPGKWWYGRLRYASLPCDPGNCSPILWSDLICLYQLGARVVFGVLFFLIFRPFRFFRFLRLSSIYFRWLFNFCAGSGLLNLWFYVAPCTVCVILCFDLPSELAAARLVSWNGFFLEEGKFIGCLPEDCASMFVFCRICCFNCWVWRFVVKLCCPSGTSPGSSYGLFLTLACCWKASGIFCPLSSKSNCVASSHELWQPHSLVDKAKDEKVKALRPKTSPLSHFVARNLFFDDVFGTYWLTWCCVFLLCKLVCFLELFPGHLAGGPLGITFTSRIFPFLFGHCWKQSDGYLRNMFWLPIYFSALCPIFFVVLLLSSSVFGTLLSRVMVRGGKMRVLPSKASPLPSSCSLWCSRETFFFAFISDLYAFFMPWIVLCHALLTWTDMLVHTFLRWDHCFTVLAYLSSLEFAGWVCQYFCHALLTWTGMVVKTFACLEYRLIVPVCFSSLAIVGWVRHHASLDQLRRSSYYWKCIFLLFGLNSYDQDWFYLTVLYNVLVCTFFPFLNRGGLCFCGKVLLQTDPCGSLDTRLEVYHHLFML